MLSVMRQSWPCCIFLGLLLLSKWAESIKHVKSQDRVGLPEYIYIQCLTIGSADSRDLRYEFSVGDFAISESDFHVNDMDIE